jgi:hypothetical protein
VPYSPKTWTTADPITDTDLNRIETGIDDVTDDFETSYAGEAANFTALPTSNTVWTTGIYYARASTASYLDVLALRGLKMPDVDYIYLSIQAIADTTAGDVKITAGANNQVYAVPTTPATTKLVRIDVSGVSDYAPIQLVLSVKNDNGSNWTGIYPRAVIASTRSALTSYDDSISYT